MKFLKIKKGKKAGLGDVCCVQDEFSGQNQSREEIKTANC